MLTSCNITFRKDTYCIYQVKMFIVRFPSFLSFLFIFVIKLCQLLVWAFIKKFLLC